MDGGGTGGMVAMGCPAGVQGHCSMATYPPYPNFTLALVEDFDAPLNLDTDPVWTYSDGSLDEGQVRMVKNAISFANGRMRLTVTREQVAGGNSFAEDKAVPARPLASGELRTKYNNYRYGRYEARFKPPTSNGNFISTMFTFRTPKVIFWREIDIELTASSKVRVGSNMVNANNQGAYPGGSAHYQEPMGPAAFDNQADFHTYAFEWLPDRVNWYLDGQMIRTRMAAASSNTPPDPTNTNNIPVPEKSAKIMMNLWIFRGDYAFGGTNGAANVYPMFAEYDWFRFYKLNTENTYPCPAPPGCLSREDLLRSKNNPTDGVADVR